MGNGLWLAKTSRRIDQRIVIEGDLVLQTPAQFGNGDSDVLTDMPLLVDACDGRSPLLTGTTLAGALRAYLHSREQGYRQADKPGQDTLTELLFGGFKGDDEGEQSALIVEDALGKGYQIEMRDGVRLDPQTRTADDGGLFDMQVWSAGTTFPIRLELLLTSSRRRGGAYQSRLRQALLTALQGLLDGGITLGGRKNRGFGQVTVSSWRLRAYDLTQPDQLMAWLRKGNEPLTDAYAVDRLEEAAVFQDVAPAADKRNLFRLEAAFQLDGSLLIRANGQPGSNSPDMVHLSNYAGEPVLPGTSVAGALRQRARRILNSVNEEQANAWLDDLFGSETVNNQPDRANDAPKVKASRLLVEETLIAKPQFDLVQNRVAIDRFTGGALESALFNEQPVFGQEDTRLTINMTIREPKQRDIGLLLLLLKDLWTGDLPLGGEISVGRGRLAGVRADMVWFDQGQTQTWTIERQDDNGRLRLPDNADELQHFVDALHEKGEKDEA
jgi:CRISPR/Cas system CSM-associated protein Csm3 (group 7 of RAMP superfamily)